MNPYLDFLQFCTKQFVIHMTMFISEQAPRAKMNQQRSRRFRASKEGVELVEEKSRIREEILGRGAYIFRKLSILYRSNSI